MCDPTALIDLCKSVLWYVLNIFTLIKRIESLISHKVLSCSYDLPTKKNVKESYINQAFEATPKKIKYKQVQNALYISLKMSTRLGCNLHPSWIKRRLVYLSFASNNFHLICTKCIVTEAIFPRWWDFSGPSLIHEKHLIWKRMIPLCRFFLPLRCKNVNSFVSWHFSNDISYRMTTLL